MTQEQLDLLVRLMREVVRNELGDSALSKLEETYEYRQCVRHLVNSTERS